MPLTPKKRSSSDASSSSPFGPKPKQQHNQEQPVGSTSTELASSLPGSYRQSYLYSETELQKEWLKWDLVNQEATEIKGGIWNDEKELEKKILALISLAIAARDNNSSAISEGSSSSPESYNRCTLVISSNLSALEYKWEKLIKDHINGDDIRYWKFVKSEWPEGKFDFSDYDLVITTIYYVIQEYKRHVGLDDETFSKTIEKANIMTVHNPSATSSKSLLHSERWQRIILDIDVKLGGHLPSRSVYALDSKYKWAISTLQNFDTDKMDLHDLICFLKVSPYSDWYCTESECPCTTHGTTPLIDSSGLCISHENCKHPYMSHCSWLSKHITDQQAKRLYYEEVIKKVQFINLGVPSQNRDT